MVNNTLISSTSISEWSVDGDFIRRLCTHISSLQRKGSQFSEEIHSKSNWLGDSKKSRLYTAFPNPDGKVQDSGPFQRGMWTDLKTVTGVSWQIGKIAVR